MMDKNLHNDIGDKFREEIEALSQPPRKQVWENLEQQLDKKDAVVYKQKFITLRRVTMVLLFLLISFAIFTFIYFNKHNGNEINNREANNKKTESKNIQQQYDITANNSSSGINNDRNKKTGNKKIIKNSNSTDNKEKNITSLFINKAKIKNNKPSVFLTEDNTIQNSDYIIPKNITSLSLKNSTVNDTINMKTPLPVFPNANAKSITDVSKNTAASKNAIKKDPAYHGFLLSFFAAPEKVFYHLKNGTSNPYDNKELIQNRQRPDISFSTGILLGYAINKHFTLQSGIGFSYANNNIAPSKIYAEKNNSGSVKYRYNTSTGYVYILPSFNSAPAVGDSLDAIRADQTVQYINVPLIAKYKFGSRKFTVVAGAGVSINFLTKAKLNTEVISNQGQEKESITKLEGLKKINFSLVLAPELQYGLSRKITFSAMPYLKYAPASVTKGNIVKTYPYNTGFGIGITYKLQK